MYVGSGKLADIALALKRHAIDGPDPGVHSAGSTDEDLQSWAGGGSRSGTGEDGSGKRGRGGSHGHPSSRHGRRRSRSASDARRPDPHRPKTLTMPRVVVDGALTPGQHHALEHALATKHRLKVDVRDRFLIVLEIFERRALSTEAKLQVELARLGYMTPFVKEWFHAGVAGEHPGFMAGGEYGVEEFLRYIRRRTVAIKQELEASETRGAVERRNLKERGWAVLGLAGYTNAGKSTLFSALSGVQAERDARLFTTLSPKSAGVTRASDGRLQARGRVKLVVEDTIGFIEGMPHDLIDGFRATLRRLRAADLTLLLIDASEPESEVGRKLSTSLSVLGAEGVRELAPVLSKADLADPAKIDAAMRLVHDKTGRTPYVLSAVTGKGLDGLVEHLLASCPGMEKIEFGLDGIDTDRGSFGRLADLMVDYRVEKREAGAALTGWCRRELVGKLRALAKAREYDRPASGSFGMQGSS